MVSACYFTTSIIFTLSLAMAFYCLVKFSLPFFPDEARSVCKSF